MRRTKEGRVEKGKKEGRRGEKRRVGSQKKKEKERRKGERKGENEGGGKVGEEGKHYVRGVYRRLVVHWLKMAMNTTNKKSLHFS